MRPTTNSLLAVATMLAVFSCGGPPDPAEEAEAAFPGPATAEMHVGNQGVYIDHQSCGAGDTTLLFVHGWAIDQTYWSHQVEDLCSEYRVVTIDLPGHGRSGTNRESWAVEDYAGDVRAVMDQLRLENVVLIGHSMGGNIILEAALGNDRVLALVGVDNFRSVEGAYDEETKARIADFVRRLETDFDSTAVAFARRNLFQPTTDGAVIDRVIRSVETVDSVSSAATLAGVYAYAPGATERLSRLKKPLYLINSSAASTDLAGLRSTGATVDLLDVGPTGHYPMLEDPRRFDLMLRQVLQDIRNPTR